MLTDALCSQKFLTATYNSAATEASDPKIRDMLMNLLTEEHQIQSEIFDEMAKRGWYRIQSAEKEAVQKVNEKFTKQLKEL